MKPRNIPSLGFPEEFWDHEGDYFCRPRPDLVATVVGSRGDLAVEINHYRSDLYEKEVHDVHPEVLEFGPTFGYLYYSWLRANGIAYWEDVDCPLQALMLIQHYLNEHPERTAEAA